MIKQTLKILPLALVIIGSIFIYLVYFGKNQISLSLNLGTSLPENLIVLEMKGRRCFRPYFIKDETFRAQCKTSKESLKKWILKKEFEVIIYKTDTVEESFKHLSKHSPLPHEILESKKTYSIQLSNIIADSPIINVMPLDDKNVLLNLNFDWN